MTDAEAVRERIRTSLERLEGAASELLAEAADQSDAREQRRLRAQAGDMRRRNREMIEFLEQGDDFDSRPLRAVLEAAR